MPHKPAVATDYERPETYPVYLAVEQVRVDGGRKLVVVGMKRTGMDTYFPDDQILHHDPAGRLSALPGQTCSGGGGPHAWGGRGLTRE